MTPFLAAFDLPRARARARAARSGLGRKLRAACMLRVGRFGGLASAARNEEGPQQDPDVCDGSRGEAEKAGSWLFTARLHEK